MADSTMTIEFKNDDSFYDDGIWVIMDGNIVISSHFSKEDAERVLDFINRNIGKPLDLAK